MRPIALASLSALLALGACADAPDPADPAPEADAPVTQAVDPAEGSDDPTAGAKRSRALGITSVYTDLDLDTCEVLEAYEMGVELRCPGYEGTDLFVSEGDLRFDVDAGVPNDRFETAPAFNTIGETVEWRLRGGVPFAVILRYFLEEGGGGRTPQLAVIAVGEEGDPGCLVGWVPVSAEPNMNQAARRLADAEAESVDCEA